MSKNNQFIWYGRRKGKKLSSRKQELLDTLLPKVCIDSKKFQEEDYFYSMFPTEIREVWLEIGFGSGEFLAAQAYEHPEVGFIGCELFQNGIATLLSHMEAKKLENIFIFDNDARLLLDHLPGNFIEKIFILFGDPWPKKKHNNRRFINDQNLKKISYVLKDNGTFVFASDHSDYIWWTLQHLTKHTDLVQGFNEDPSTKYATRYQNKAITRGFSPSYLTYTRAKRS